MRLIVLPWIHQHFDFVGRYLAAFAVICWGAATLWKLDNDDEN